MYNLLLLTIMVIYLSSCSFIYDRDRNNKITVEEMKPITETSKVNCDVDSLKTLTELQIAKCRMEAKLLELKY